MKPPSSVRVAGILFLLTVPVLAQDDPLRLAFKSPPDAAKPRVWWHWMNGNITKEGIKLDLEWMHRVGIAGFQNFDAALQTPQVVEKRLAYMTPEWKDAFKYAIKVGDQLRHGDGDRRLAGMERVGRSVGAGVTRDEEVCLERNAAWRAERPSPARWLIPRPTPAPFRTWASASSSDEPLCRPLRSSTPMPSVVAFRVPPGGSGDAATAEDHLQRRGARSRDAERRRPGEDHPRADSRKRLGRPGFSTNTPRPIPSAPSPT